MHGEKLRIGPDHKLGIETRSFQERTDRITYVCPDQSRTGTVERKFGEIENTYHDAGELDSAASFVTIYALSSDGSKGAYVWKDTLKGSASRLIDFESDLAAKLEQS